MRRCLKIVPTGTIIFPWMSKISLPLVQIILFFVSSIVWPIVIWLCKTLVKGRTWGLEITRRVTNRRSWFFRKLPCLVCVHAVVLANENAPDDLYLVLYLRNSRHVGQLNLFDACHWNSQLPTSFLYESWNKSEYEGACPGLRNRANFCFICEELNILCLPLGSSEIDFAVQWVKTWTIAPIPECSLNLMMILHFTSFNGGHGSKDACGLWSRHR